MYLPSTIAYIPYPPWGHILIHFSCLIHPMIVFHCILLLYCKIMKSYEWINRSLTPFVYVMWVFWMIVPIWIRWNPMFDVLLAGITMFFILRLFAACVTIPYTKGIFPLFQTKDTSSTTITTTTTSTTPTNQSNGSKPRRIHVTSPSMKQEPISASNGSTASTSTSTTSTSPTSPPTSSPSLPIPITLKQFIYYIVTGTSTIPTSSDKYYPIWSMLWGIYWWFMIHIFVYMYMGMKHVCGTYPDLLKSPLSISTLSYTMTYDLIMGLILMSVLQSGTCFILSILSLVVGTSFPPLWNSPYLSTSPRNFWGYRWNIIISHTLRTSCYDGVVKACTDHDFGRGSTSPSPFPQPLASLLTFIVSGLIHEFSIWVAFPSYSNEYYGQQMIFFIMQWILIVSQTILMKLVSRSFTQSIPHVIKTALTAIIMLLPARYFFIMYHVTQIPHILQGIMVF